MLETFGIERSLSAKGCPYDNAVDESTNRILKAELVHRETFGTTRELRAELSDYVHWYNNFRIHSTLGYMSPVEFRKAGCPSRNRPNKCCQSTQRALSGAGPPAVRGRPVGGPFWARLNRSPRRSRADNFDCNGRS